MTDTNNETYLMLDIEVTGPVSAYHSMIEFAVVHRNGNHEDYFSVSLKEFVSKGGVWRWEDDTYKWWHHPSRVQLLHDIESEAIDPIVAMQMFKDWLKNMNFRNPTIAQFGSDIEWLKLYWWDVFKENPPFGLLAVDGKSFSMPTCGLDFMHTGNSTLRKRVPFLFDKSLPHTHRALDDAREQAVMFDRLQHIASLIPREELR